MALPERERWTAVTPPVRGSTVPSRRADLLCQAKTARVNTSSKHYTPANWTPSNTSVGVRELEYG